MEQSGIDAIRWQQFVLEITFYVCGRETNSSANLIAFHHATANAVGRTQIIIGQFHFPLSQSGSNFRTAYIDLVDI